MQIVLGDNFITVIGTPSVEMLSKHSGKEYLWVFLLVNVIGILVSVGWLQYAIKRHCVTLLSQARELDYERELELQRKAEAQLNLEKERLESEVVQRAAAEQNAREAVEARTAFFAKMVPPLCVFSFLLHHCDYEPQCFPFVCPFSCVCLYRQCLFPPSPMRSGRRCMGSCP